MRQRGTTVAGPVPVGSFIEIIGELANLCLDGGIAVEIGGERQCAREKECRIDRREFAFPNAAARFNVQKVVEEALVTGGVRLWSLRAFQQVSQSPASDLSCTLPSDSLAEDHELHQD